MIFFNFLKSCRNITTAIGLPKIVGFCFYMPEKEHLKAVRQQILQYPDEFLGIIENPGFKAIFPEMLDHRLKTAPRGFPKDHPYIDLLRYKSFVFSTTVTDEELTGEKLIEKTISAFKHLCKINSFLNEALETV